MHVNDAWTSYNACYNTNDMGMDALLLFCK